MASMLIMNVVLLFVVVISSAFSENFTVTTTTRTKRDLTTPLAASIIWATQSTNSLPKKFTVSPIVSSTSTTREPIQASTTVHTISVRNPGVTYSPHQHRQVNSKDPSRSSPTARGISHQTIDGQPPLQGGFQASNVQFVDHRLEQNGRMKNSPSYLPQATHHYSNKLLLRGNEDPQNFASGSYRFIPESGKVSSKLRTSTFPKSGDFPPFPKFKSSSSTLSGSTYDNSFEKPGKYRFGPGTTINTHSSLNSGTSQRTMSPIYKSTTYPSSLNLDISPSSFSSEFSGSPTNFGTYDKSGYKYHQYGGPSSDYIKKKSPIPVSLQLHESPEVSAGLVKAFENEPVLLSTGFDYQTHPSSGSSNFDYSKSRPISLSNGPSSFAGNVGNYQPHSSHIHSSTSTSRIPHYKTATLNGFSPNEYNNPADAYQHLSHQPQLHFPTGSPVQTVNHQYQPLVYRMKPFEQIRADAEVIDRKRLTTPRPYDNDENDFEPDFKTAGREFGYFADGDKENSRPFDISGNNGNFELPSSNLFNSYDEAFGKYSKLASIEHKPYTPVHQQRGGPEQKRAPLLNEQPTKPVHQSVEEEDEAEPQDEKSSLGEYRSSYTDDRPDESNHSYEAEDEEERRTNERQRYDDDSNERSNDDDSAEESAAYKSYSGDYEKDFEESYRQDEPKSDYAHVKEVPVSEEITSESRKRPYNRDSIKPSRTGSKQKSRYVTETEYEEPKKNEKKTNNRYEQTTKSHYRDNEGHDSTTSYKRTKEPRSEETYGSKISRNRGATRYANEDDKITRLTTDEVPTRKGPNPSREPQSRVDKFSRSTTSTTQRPLTSTLTTIETVHSYTFPPFGSWKLNNEASRDHDTYGATAQEVRAIFNPENSGYQLDLQREAMTYDDQRGRDLRGI